MSGECVAPNDVTGACPGTHRFPTVAPSVTTRSRARRSRTPHRLPGPPQPVGTWTGRSPALKGHIRGWSPHSERPDATGRPGPRPGLAPGAVRRSPPRPGRGHGRDARRGRRGRGHRPPARVVGLGGPGPRCGGHRRGAPLRSRGERRCAAAGGAHPDVGGARPDAAGRLLGRGRGGRATGRVGAEGEPARGAARRPARPAGPHPVADPGGRAGRLDRRGPAGDGHAAEPGPRHQEDHPGRVGRQPARGQHLGQQRGAGYSVARVDADDPVDVPRLRAPPAGRSADHRPGREHHGRASATWSTATG